MNARSNTQGQSSGGNFHLLQIEIDSILLSVMTAQLVEKINRGFKFTIGQPIMTEAMNQGRFIRKGIRLYRAADKLKCFSAAAGALEALEYGVEVALCAGKVTPAEKAAFDLQFEAVQKQLQAFITSQTNRLSQNKGDGNLRQAKQSSGGSASEATSE